MDYHAITKRCDGMCDSCECPPPKRCEHCDGTGDVTGRDGEWRGYCTCDAGQTLKAWSKPPCQQCGAMTADDALSRCMGARAEGGCHGNDLWPD